MANVKTRWYKDAVIYQIYPRSFCDSNGDGVGDLRGIISKLDYLGSLGIDAVWLSPVYKSPNADNGYDISDYRDINEEFGTLDDFRELIDGLHQRGIKLIMDLVSNHSSDEHMWFEESKKSKDNPYRDYYFWRPGKGQGGKRPPNNWKSNFLGSAWKYDSTTDEYYLHLFAEKQPDLNWDNPKVRQEIADICNYWFDMGVDGFRCDVITYISKTQGLPDGFPLDPRTGQEQYILGPNWKKYIEEMNDKSWGNHDSMIVGEAVGITYKNAGEYISENIKGLDTCFSFEHTMCDIPQMLADSPYPVKSFKKVMANWQSLSSDCQPTLYIENHDQPRSVPRMTGDPGDKRREASKMLCIAMMMQRGTPYIYEGQEIGMTNCCYDDSEYKDVLTENTFALAKKLLPLPVLDEHFKNFWKRRARDNARTPMQWDASDNAGFTTGTPWMKVNPNKDEINVSDADSDPDSILNFYRDFLKFRKGNDVIINGTFRMYMPDDNDIFMYERAHKGKRYLVICNFRNKKIRLFLPIELIFRSSKLAKSNYADSPAHLHDLTLREYEALVYEIN
jgi:oligo-1,6-glucosidase